MMMRLGELLIGQRSPDVFAEIEGRQPNAESRWEHEQRVLGLTRPRSPPCWPSTGIFRNISSGLQNASAPLRTQPFDRWRARCTWPRCWPIIPRPRPRWWTNYPQDLIAALQLSRLWMVGHFPAWKALSIPAICSGF